MSSLVRTRVGQFSLDGAYTLKQVEMLREQGKLLEHLIPTDQMFCQFPAVVVQGRAKKRAYNGNPLAPDELSWEKVKTNEREKRKGSCRIYDKEGCFIGIYSYREGSWRPVKMFLEAGGKAGAGE